MSGHLRVIPTDKYINDNSNWESHLQSVIDKVKSKFNNSIGEGDLHRLYVQLETDKTISLNSNCREAMSSCTINSLSCVEVRVDNKSLSDHVDAVLVVDSYDYPGIDGCAQVAEAEDSDPAVGFVGGGGDEKFAMLHETLHMYGAKHKHHRVYSGAWCTVMGPNDIGCDGENPPNSPVYVVNQSNGCTADKVGDYMSSNDT